MDRRLLMAEGLPGAIVILPARTVGSRGRSLESWGRPLVGAVDKHIVEYFEGLEVEYRNLVGRYRDLRGRARVFGLVVGGLVVFPRGGGTRVSSLCLGGLGGLDWDGWGWLVGVAVVVVGLVEVDDLNLLVLEALDLDAWGLGTVESEAMCMLKLDMWTLVKGLCRWNMELLTSRSASKARESLFQVREEKQLGFVKSR